MGMKKSFTLIELLIVVAIIAILIAILLPALSQTKERARRAICTSNQRQFLVAMTLFANDNDSNYPDFNDGGSWRHIHWLKWDKYNMLKDDYDLDVAEGLGCPSRDKSWNVYKDSRRIRIGYFIQVGRPFATLGTSAGTDGRLGYKWTPWQSPIRAGESNSGDLVMISDVDEYLLNVGFTGGPGTWSAIGAATAVSHTSSGYKIGPANQAIEPVKLGAQGVMVGLENGAVQWREASEAEPHRSNIGENRKTGWW